MGKVQKVLAWMGVLVLSSAVSAQTASDKSFLAKSSQGNVAEIELAKLALKKAVSADVKSFASKMVHDHQMLANTMRPFLDRAGVAAPTSLDKEHQSLFNKLDGLAAEDFDKEYVKAMEKDHLADLAEYKKESGSTSDPALKKVVTSGQRVIAQHAQMIMRIASKMGLSPPGQTEREAGRVVR